MTRREWFTRLAALCYPTAPAVAMQAFLVFEEQFRDVPNPAFTAASLDHVARQPRRMAIPSYDEVRNPLAAWWMDHRPMPRQLPAPTSPVVPPPTPEQRAAVSQMLRDAGIGLRMPRAFQPPRTASVPLPSAPTLRPVHVSPQRLLLGALDRLDRASGALREAIAIEVAGRCRALGVPDGAEPREWLRQQDEQTE